MTTDTKPPARIYLQCRDDLGELIPPDNDITWCEDNINDTDEEYVRSDIATALVEALEAAVPFVPMTQGELSTAIGAKIRLALALAKGNP